MKRIVFFSKNMNIGGMEKALLILLNSFDKDDFEIDLYLESKQGALLQFLNKNINVKEIKISNSKKVIPRKIYNFLNRVIWILKNKNKYDFSCNYATYSIIGSKLAIAASKNSLLYVHSDYYNLYKKNSKLIKEFFSGVNIEKFKNVCFVSNESLNNLLNIYPEYKNKFIVLNNLFDYKNVLKSASEEIEFKYNKSHKQLIFIGRLEEESKNLSLLLKIMKELKKEKIDLIIIGDGKDKELCENYIRINKLENVHMLGEKVNPYPFLKLADALILTSRYEGHPIVFSEAILLKKPIITTLTVSDKYISIGEKYGILIKNEKDAIKIKKILEKSIEFETVDFKKINEDRMKDIIDIIKN